MFSLIVPENSAGSWNTTPTWERSCGSGTSVTSLPSTRSWPPVRWYSPSSRLVRVVLPTPLSPTNATRSPLRTSKLSPRSTSVLSPP